MATVRDLDSRLLRLLRSEPPDAAPPLPELAAHLGVDAPTVLARLDGLRVAGYEIDASPGHGCPLRAPARLIADDLCAALPEDTAGVGREILVFEETDSTNDLAARAGRDGARGGLVIFAEAQRAGRGRLGRRWTSPPYRALLFSVLLRPNSVPAARWPELTFCAALAVAETAETLTGQTARIKWPNDVLLDGRKIAGILLERYQDASAGFVVVGIGLNVLQREEDFPPELRDRAGSLAMFAPPDCPPARLLAAATVLRRLEALLLRWPDSFRDIEAACVRRGCTRPPEDIADMADRPANV